MTGTQLSLLDAPKPPVIDDERRGLYVGMVRAFKGQPAAHVVELGIEAYRHRYGDDPLVVLTSFADAADLEGKTALRVEPKTYISGGNFYIGRDAA